MKVFTLKFREVGRNKETFGLMFSGESMDDVPTDILREIRTRASLMSNSLELEWNEETGEGQVIVGGFRPIGSFSFGSVEQAA